LLIIIAQPFSDLSCIIMHFMQLPITWFFLEVLMSHQLASEHKFAITQNEMREQNFSALPISSQVLPMQAS